MPHGRFAPVRQSVPVLTSRLTAIAFTAVAVVVAVVAFRTVTAPPGDPDIQPVVVPAGATTDPAPAPTDTAPQPVTPVPQPVDDRGGDNDGDDDDDDDGGGGGGGGGGDDDDDDD